MVRGPEVFEKTVQKTELWLNELMEKMGWSDRHMAYDGLRAVLHVLRDRLTVEAVAKFGAQLPMLVRGFYYEGWVPSATPIKFHRQEDFINLTRDYLRRTNVKEENIEMLVYSVFDILRNHMESGEIEKIKAILPAPLAAFWGTAAARV
jgi:uncharacterized protein (DUF2267 family)